MDKEEFEATYDLKIERYIVVRQIHITSTFVVQKTVSTLAI